MGKMGKGGKVLTCIQCFGAGSIVMAFIADYNRSQLPLAAICLLYSVILRLKD